MASYTVYTAPESGRIVKAWVAGVPVEEAALDQLQNLARLPFIHKWVAAMPDVHFGIGATVGCVIPTRGAIIPAAVGVDIGCGMMAVRTTLTRRATCPTAWRAMRAAIERAVPHGRTNHGGPGDRAPGARRPTPSTRPGPTLAPRLRAHRRRSTRSSTESNHCTHLGTLGTRQPLHRGLPRRGGPRLVHAAQRLARRRQRDRHATSSSWRKQDMRAASVNLPDQDLAYFAGGREHFDDYVDAVGWAQDFAPANRELMMAARSLARRADGQAAAVPRPTSRRSTATTTTSRASTTSAKTCSSRARARCARGDGRARHHPGQHGRAQLHRARQGQPRELRELLARRRAARCRAARRKRRFTLEDHARPPTGVECRKDADVHRRDARRLQGHRRRHGGAGGPGRDRAHAAPGRLRQGVGGDTEPCRGTRVVGCLGTASLCAEAVPTPAGGAVTSRPSGHSARWRFLRLPVLRGTDRVPI